MTRYKEAFKDVIGHIPFTAELYCLLRDRRKPLQSKFQFTTIPENLDAIRKNALILRENMINGKPKKVFLFASLHYWIEHAAILASTFAAMGHTVTLNYLPIGDWRMPINSFDLKRHNIYVKNTLAKAGKLFQSFSILNVRTSGVRLPQELEKAVEEVSIFDTQYTAQVEDVNTTNEFYLFRHRRNLHAAKAIYSYLLHNPQDHMVIPNGMIQEFGIAYRIARFLNIPVVTYEFGEQRDRIWIAQDSEIMKHNTDSIWEACQDITLTDEQLKKVQKLVESRRKGKVHENFFRKWQIIGPQGAQKVKEELQLDDRVIALLALNVVGDSLTLGRQVFSKSMTEWVQRTVQYFAGRKDAQLVIRAHPGEALLKGTSMVDVIRRDMPKLPDNIRLIGPKDDINTYDLIHAADFGIVYTTTAGLEMALSGLPVIVTGSTHYRGRGFTYDPDSWVSFFKLLGQFITQSERTPMSKEQVDNAWKYAYLFFYKFALPFPWHLARIKEDYGKNPIQDLFKKNGKHKYLESIRYLLGEPIDWTRAVK